MLNVVVIGHGFLGKWHTEKVFNNKEVHLFGIVEANHKAHADIKSKYPQTNIYLSVHDLEISKVDAAIIATPTSTHFELTKFFLENNKHVFCEKPLCATTEEAEALEPFLKDNLVLQVGHSERYHPIWETFKQDIKHTTGPYCIRIDRLAPFKGRATDVDVVQDLMIHDLDLVNFLFSDLKLKNISSIGFKQRTDFTDFAESVLAFEDGSRAILSVGRNYVQEKRLLEVSCIDGCFQIDLLNAVYLKALGSSKEDFVQKIEYQKADHLQLEQLAFFSCIENKTVNPVNFQDGLSAVKLVDQVRDQINE